MGCADYRIYCDGDSDGNGNDLLYGVLDEKSVLESDFPERFVFSLYVVMGCYFFFRAEFVQNEKYSTKSGDYLRFLLYLCHVIDDFACLDLQH